MEKNNNNNKHQYKKKKSSVNVYIINNLSKIQILSLHSTL